MVKARRSRKPPSRKRYDEAHRVRSVRLDKEYDERLDKLLTALGLSFSDFMRAHIRNDEAMIEKRVEMLASRQIDPSVEHRLRCIEDLVQQIFTVSVDTDEYPPYCPHCENQELFQAEGRETESSLAHPVVFTWKCPGCGFFVDTYKRIDPKSIKWIDPDSGKYINKPRTSARHRPKKRKRG